MQSEHANIINVFRPRSPPAGNLPVLCRCARGVSRSHRSFIVMTIDPPSERSDDLLSNDQHSSSLIPSRISETRRLLRMPSVITPLVVCHSMIAVSSRSGRARH